MTARSKSKWIMAASSVLAAADARPFGLPGVFLTRAAYATPAAAVPSRDSRDVRRPSMRTAHLAATLAGLAVAVPAAAQTPKSSAPREPAAHDVFVAVLSGAYEVPPIETQATGTAELSLVGSQLHYRLHVDSIGDITGAYIHLGGAGY